MPEYLVISDELNNIRAESKQCDKCEFEKKLGFNTPCDYHRSIIKYLLSKKKD